MKKAAEITGVETEVSRRVYFRHSRVQEPGHTQPPNALTNRPYFPTYVMSHLAQRYRNRGEKSLTVEDRFICNAALRVRREVVKRLRKKTFKIRTRDQQTHN